MKYFASIVISSLLACGLAPAVQAQAPVDNPYRTHYNPSGGHWTDSLLWWRTVDVTTFGAVANDNQDDYAAIQEGIDTLHARGGGVLFLPAGMYNSSESLKMKSGVVLRGVASIEPNSLDSAFAPQSKIWFPQFILDTLANGGLGNDRNAAFKSIESEFNCKYSGVVDLDLNRVSMKFQPSYETNVPGFSTPQASSEISHIIIMGVRSNNAAYAAPDIPLAQQKPWQVNSWRFSANVDVAGHHVVVARNRMNQGVPKDNFMMPGYRIERRGSGGGWFDMTEAQRPLFDYDANYCISVNRKKSGYTSTGARAIFGVVTWASPETEPALFHPQIEILDNWMYKTSRVAIIAAGVDVTIRGNEMRDDPTKPSYNNVLGNTGRLTPQGATTFENRGIDFSGWRILCENNVVEAYRHRTGSYLSTDGEGILVQECCGGTSVNDYTIRNNEMIGGNYIGIYKMRDCHNVLIEGNNFYGTNMQVTANTNNNIYSLYNVQVRNNINISGILLNGSVGGYNVHSEGNRFTGTGGISHPCYATETDNLYISNQTPVIVRYNSNNGVTLNPGVIATPAGSCLPTLTAPLVQWASTHAPDSIFTNGLGVPTTVLLKAKMQTGDLLTDTVAIYLNGVKIADSLAYSIFDSIARYTYDIPDANGIYSFTAKSYNSGTFGLSTTINYIQNNIVSVDAHLKSGSLMSYPNPTKGHLNVVLPSSTGTLRVLDITGKTMRSQDVNMHAEGEALQLDLNGFKQGVYLLQFASPAGNHTQRIVKQ